MRKIAKKRFNLDLEIRKLSRAIIKGQYSPEPVMTKCRNPLCSGCPKGQPHDYGRK